MINYSITVQPGFEGALISSALNYIASQIKISASLIENEVRAYLRDRIIKSDTWKSLIFGKLRGELGLNRRIQRLQTVLNMWEKSITVTAAPRISGKAIYDVLVIKLIDGDYTNVTSLPEATIQSKGGDVPWLYWLLFAGTSIVVGNYHLKTNLTQVEKQHSRTGEGLMLPGQVYRVSSQFAGTQGDNFVTRALSDAEQEITKIIVKRF